MITFFACQSTDGNIAVGAIPFLWASASGGGRNALSLDHSPLSRLFNCSIDEQNSITGRIHYQVGMPDIPVCRLS
jgi:hypothetical protein